MRMKTTTAVILLCMLAPSGLAAQSDPFSSHARYLHEGMKMILIRSAERMPAEHYDFKPTEEVRSYSQVLGHVADMHYLYCSTVLGERNPAPGIEATRTAKADVIAALKDALSYCDAAYGGMTDVAGASLVPFAGAKAPKLALLGVNQLHSALHYGNLVTYMRLKGIVPPTSDPGFMPQPGR
jgi:uncharacterized damage-inducible protein DinB